MMGTNEEKESWKSFFSIRLDDGEDKIAGKVCRKTVI